MGVQAFIDGNTGKLIQLTARSPVQTRVSRANRLFELSARPSVEFAALALRRARKTLWPETQAVGFQAGVASTG